jgi:hypothetical protein
MAGSAQGELHHGRSRVNTKGKNKSPSGKSGFSATSQKDGHVTESVYQLQDGLGACGSDAIPPSLAWLLFYMLSSWAVAVFFLSIVFQGLGFMGSFRETGFCVASLGVYGIVYAALPQLQSLLRWSGARRWSDAMAWICVITIHVTVFCVSASFACQFADLKLRWLCGYLVCTFQIRLQEGINCLSLVDDQKKSTRKKKNEVRNSESKSKDDDGVATSRAAKIMSAGYLVS